MENKVEILLPSLSQTHTKDLPNVSFAARAADSHKEHCSPGDDSDSFYGKLVELLESSGLTLIFNVREALLDLYLFYLEVTRRGGYHQVGREKKWGEVVIALKLEGNSVKLCAQVERLYSHLLYQFEQLYFYRLPAKQTGRSGSNKGPLRKKRISTASLPRIMDIKEGQKATEMSKHYSCHMTGAEYVQQPVLLPTPSKEKKTASKEKKKRRGAPVGQKTAYQIFLKHECARLKTCNQALDGKILSMAIHSWRTMSEIEKQPYVEESKKNKEEIKEAMVSHSKHQSTQDTREEKWSSMCGDYHVTSQPEAGDSLVNKGTVGVALKMTEKAPKDPSFQMDWDGYRQLDFATRESE